jgi:putative flippase GtrA
MTVALLKRVATLRFSLRAREESYAKRVPTAGIARGGSTTINAIVQPKLVRFVIVGGSAAALLFGLILAFTSLGLAPLWAGPIGYAISFSYAYSLQRGWTFRGRHPHRRALPRYFIAQAACALLSGVVAQAAATFNVSHTASSLIAAIAASVLSYCLSLFWVFPGQPR